MKVTQLHPTLCDPMDCPWNSPGQNTGVGRVAFPFSRGSPGDLPNPGVEPRSPALQVNSLPAEISGKPGESWNSKVNSKGRVHCSEEMCACVPFVDLRKAQFS